MSKENILKWMSNWYLTNCDGDWEHNYGITISTLDNPGWSVSIDLLNTNVFISNSPWVFIENSEHDWYGYKVEDGKFEASGDPSKLEFLIYLFKKIIENNKLMGSVK